MNQTISDTQETNMSQNPPLRQTEARRVGSVALRAADRRD
jgi:hypothetical protein